MKRICFNCVLIFRDHNPYNVNINFIKHIRYIYIDGTVFTNNTKYPHNFICHVCNKKFNINRSYIIKTITS